VIELLSNKTRHIDRGEKMHVYSKIWRTPEYFLYDPLSHELEGYRLDAATFDYEPIEPGPGGDLECRVLGLGLGVREGRFEDVTFRWLRWLAPDGAPLPTSQELAVAADARAETAQARAEVEQARADAEQARADALERRLRELESQAKRD
jgi:hypothetical protein